MNAAEGKKTSGESATTRERKTGLSCAECRRSKLKCDRIFPCQSCVRRGCAGICPSGTLAATKGNKVLMAHAEKLTEQVKTLTQRIHELEAALSSQANGGHHLLSRKAEHAGSESPSAKEWPHHGQSTTDTIGSLSIGIEGQFKYHGESAGSEYLHELLPPAEGDWQPRAPKCHRLPEEIIDLMNSFPFGMRDSPYDKYLFLPYIPSRERALELSDLYYKHVAWMYDPIVRDDFMANIMEPIYGKTGTISLHAIHSHTLSTFFVLLGSGVLHDPHPDAQSLSNQYLALSRAALSLDPIFQEATCATVQALFMILRYNYNFDRNSTEERWLLLGVCVRVAQAIGLQRDSSVWQLDPEEIQRRRNIFWEILLYDAWTSIVNGRPPALVYQHTDCQFPEDHEPYIKSTGEKGLGWHAWKIRYAAACLSLSAQHVFSARVPPYQALLELDKTIRKYPVPSHLQCPIQMSEVGRSWSTDPVRAMQQYCIVCLRESNLLYIHRSYFTQAIRQNSEDPLQHQFAQSVLVTYRSACRIISSLRGLYQVHREAATSCWFFWSSVFSSCIIFGALVIESPACKLAHDAFLELERALPFYEEGSKSIRPPATLPTLQKLLSRARGTLAAFRTGGGTTLGLQKSLEGPDELEVLEGRRSVIQDRGASNSPASLVSSQQGSYHEDNSSHEGGSISGVNRTESLMDYYREFSLPLTETRDYVSPANTGAGTCFTGGQNSGKGRASYPPNDVDMGYADLHVDSFPLRITRPLSQDAILPVPGWHTMDVRLSSCPQQNVNTSSFGYSLQADRQLSPNSHHQQPPPMGQSSNPQPLHMCSQQYPGNITGYTMSYPEINQPEAWNNPMGQYGLY